MSQAPQTSDASALAYAFCPHVPQLNLTLLLSTTLPSSSAEPASSASPWPAVRVVAAQLGLIGMSDAQLWAARAVVRARGRWW